MHRPTRQAGYTLLELMVSLGIMLTLMAVAMRFMNEAVNITNVTAEVTEAQQNLRTAQDFIARDITGTADGMQNIKSPRMTISFLAYVTTLPVSVTGSTTQGVLGVVTSDDQAPAGTAVPIPSPSPSSSTPVLQATDRLTLMRIDKTFNSNTGSISLGTTSTSADGKTVTLPVGTVMTPFKIGDIYFFTSTNGSAFGSVTAISGTALTFNANDRYKMNEVAATGPIAKVVANSKPTTMMRMLLIHYYVDSSGLLRRRVYGVAGGGGYTDSVVAEHVADLQFRYLLGKSNTNGTLVQPVTKLTTEDQQSYVRQVEVTVTTETTHTVGYDKDGNRIKHRMSMTGTTAVRNMQFNTHLKMS